MIGGANACTKCACPLPDNSFSDTCLSVKHGRGYVCDACKLGYTGAYCENCSIGYYGNPNVVGGICQECACHEYGSLHEICNQVSFHYYFILDDITVSLIKIGRILYSLIFVIINAVYCKVYNDHFIQIIDWMIV